MTLVETLGEGLVRDSGGYVWIGGEDVAQLAAVVCGSKCAPLYDSVRLLARHPGFLDEREQHTTAAVESQAALDVLAHSLRPDDQPLDESARLDEHVVQQDRRLREEDALGRRVANVTLVPEAQLL